MSRDYLASAPDTRDEKYWQTMGYRTWFPLFYYIYAELKNQLGSGRTWSIYSGSNNPVMNWQEGWLTREWKGRSFQYYWEFNYQDLFLKVRLLEPKMDKGELTALRQRVHGLCEGRGRNGSPTSNRYGQYNSVYKWSFDFARDGLQKVALETNGILDDIHTRL